MHIQLYQLMLIIGSRKGLVKGKMQRGEKSDLFKDEVWGHDCVKPPPHAPCRSLPRRKPGQLFTQPSI